MKKIKQLISVALLLVIPFVTIHAQENSENTEPLTRVKLPKISPEQKAAAITDTINAVVSLSTEQYKVVYDANLKYVTAKLFAIKNSNGDQQIALDKIKGISKIRRKEIAGILSAEQKSKWLSWKKNRNLISSDSNDESIDMTNESKPVSISVDVNGL